MERDAAELTAPQTLGTGATDLWLDGTATDLTTGDTVLLVGPEREGSVADEHWDARRVRSVKPDFDAKRTRVVLGPGLGSTHPASAPSSAPKVYAMRTRAGVFGQNAAEWKAMSADFRPTISGIRPPLPRRSSGPISPSTRRAAHRPVDSATLDLDQVYPAVLQGSWLLLATPDYAELFKVTRAVSASRAQFGLAGKTSRVTIDRREPRSVHEPRPDDGRPRPEPWSCSRRSADRPSRHRTRPGAHARRRRGTLPEGRHAAGRRQRTRRPAERARKASSLSPRRGGRERSAASSSRRRSRHSYRLDGLTIHGNVAAATHGESGLGGARLRRRRAALPAFRPPPAAPDLRARPDAASGAVSTLEVRVNDLRWDEVPTFYGRGPPERVYVTRRDDDGKTTVPSSATASTARGFRPAPRTSARTTARASASPATSAPASSPSCSRGRSA